MKELRTTKSIIRHFGDGDQAKGFKRLCVITKSNRKQAYNWLRDGNKLPAATYVAMQRELARLEATAPDTLWNMRGI